MGLIGDCHPEAPRVEPTTERGAYERQLALVALRPPGQQAQGPHAFGGAQAGGGLLVSHSVDGRLDHRAEQAGGAGAQPARHAPRAPRRRRRVAAGGVGG